MIKRIAENPYLVEKVKGVIFDLKNPKSVSMTKQSFGKEADINSIIAKFVKTGILGDVDAIKARKAVFTDVSNFGDFQSAMNRVKAIEVMFEQLPAHIRMKFDYSPVNLMEFMQDPVNNKECVELGLLPKEDLIVPKEPAEPESPKANDIPPAA